MQFVPRNLIRRTVTVVHCNPRLGAWDWPLRSRWVIPHSSFGPFSSFRFLADRSVFSSLVDGMVPLGWFPEITLPARHTCGIFHLVTCIFSHRSVVGLLWLGLAWLHPPSALCLLEMDRGSGKSVSLTCSGGLLHRCCRLQMGKSHFPVLRGPTDATVPLLLLLLLPSYQGLI